MSGPPGTMHDEVLQTKINAPPLRGRVISRPRLLDRLESSKHQKLILITAPAGFGKSTLLSEWSAARAEPISWFSIDASDNDPKAFWVHFISAIRVVHPDIGHTALEMLASPHAVPVRAILTALLNEIFTQTGDVFLILDDYHLIEHSEIHEGLSFLIEHMPPRAYIVIASRRQLPFSVGRLRINGQMAEFNVDDLRFTRTEVERFAGDIMGRSFDEEAIAELHAHSEGWAAGLQIAALAAERHEESPAPLLPEVQSHIVDYFMAEVFTFQPAHIQRFLKDSAILERLTAPLCDAVLDRDDSASVLQYLSSANIFILPLDQRGIWYRYHHMLTDILQARLLASEPERYRRLNEKASRWFAGMNFPNEAIQHALAAEDWAFATDLVNKHAAIQIRRGDSATALRWLREFPGSWIAKNPMLCLSYAWALFLTHLSKFSSMPFHEIEQLLQDAEKFYTEPARKEGATYQTLTVHIDVLRMHLAYSRNEPREKVIALGTRTIEKFSESSVFIRTNIDFTLALAYLDAGDLQACNRSLDAARSAAMIGGFCFQVVLTDSFKIYLGRIRGRLQEAALICRNGRQSVMQSFIQSRKLPPEMLGYYDVHEAAFLYENNELEAAAQLIDEAVASVELMGEPVTQLSAYRLMFYIRLARRADAEAINYPLHQMKALSVHTTVAHRIAAVLRIRYLTHRACPDGRELQAAFGLAEQQGLSLEGSSCREDLPYPVPFIRYLHVSEQLALVRLHLAASGMPKKEARALSLQTLIPHISELLVKAGQEGFGELELEALILMALAMQARKEPQDALEAFKKALSRAKTEGYFRVFVNEGERLKPLLQQCVDSGYSVYYGQWILDAIGAEVPESSALAAADTQDRDAKEKLSRQERTILKLMASGMTNREIADTLCIALTTVKTHNYRIFKKLNVSNRMHAAGKARELEL